MRVHRRGHRGPADVVGFLCIGVVSLRRHASACPHGHSITGQSEWSQPSADDGVASRMGVRGRPSASCRAPCSAYTHRRERSADDTELHHAWTDWASSSHDIAWGTKALRGLRPTVLAELGRQTQVKLNLSRQAGSQFMSAFHAFTRHRLKRNQHSFARALRLQRLGIWWTHRRSCLKSTVQRFTHFPHVAHYVLARGRAGLACDALGQVHVSLVERS